MDILNEETLEQYLKTLSYTRLWLERGVLTAEMLALQIQFRNEQTNEEREENPEHFRLAAFRNFLEKRTFLSDDDLEHLILLATQDSERFMAGAALVEIFSAIQLTKAQFERLAEVLSGFGAWAERRVQKEREKFGLGNNLVDMM